MHAAAINEATALRDCFPALSVLCPVLCADGERVGSLSVVCADAEEATRVKSQLQLIIRPMYSSPPIHGALLVSEVMTYFAFVLVL